MKNKEWTGDWFKAPSFNKFLELIEWGIMLMSMPGRCGQVIPFRKQILEFGFNSIKTYDGAMITGTGHKIENSPYDYNQWEFMKDERVTMRDIDYDLSGMKILNINSGGDCFFHKARFLDQKELRGTAHIGKRIIEISCSQLQVDGKWINMRVHYQYIDNGMLRAIVLNIPDRISDCDSKFSNHLQDLLRVQFVNYYQWFVYIKEYDDLGFRIPIGIDSLRSIFELRDVEQEGRRKAIIHWVGKHYRKVMTNKELDEFTYTKVKQHLRGETKFNWNGLSVNIIPSKYDIKRVNSKAKKYYTVS